MQLHFMLLLLLHGNCTIKYSFSTSAEWCRLYITRGIILVGLQTGKIVFIHLFTKQMGVIKRRMIEGVPEESAVGDVLASQ